MIVRGAERKDLAAVLELMGELAEHEGVRQYLALTSESLADCCLREPKRFHVLVAVEDEAGVGCGPFLLQVAPWGAPEDLNLGDLFVGASKRRRGSRAPLR